MPPRPKPPLARIAPMIVSPAGMTEESLASELASWAGPLSYKPHWIWGGHTTPKGMAMVWNGAQSEQVCRVLFAVIYNRPLISSWRMERICDELHCVSPFHRRPKSTRGADGFVEKLPGLETRETVDDLVKLFRAGWDFKKLIDQGKDFNMVVDANIIFDEEAAAET